jgi:hypothetical protein
MAQLPRWLLGRHLTAITVTPQTQAVDGTLSNAEGASSLSGYVDYVRLENDPMLEMIQSVDRTNTHYEGTLEDFTLVLGEILTVKTAHVPVLPSMAGSYDHYLVAFTRGGQSYSVYLRRGAFRDGVTAFGKNACELTMRSVDIGGAVGNPLTFTP